MARLKTLVEFSQAIEKDFPPGYAKRILKDPSLWEKVQAGEDSREAIAAAHEVQKGLVAIGMNISIELPPIPETINISIPALVPQKITPPTLLSDVQEPLPTSQYLTKLGLAIDKVRKFKGFNIEDSESIDPNTLRRIISGKPVRKGSLQGAITWLGEKSEQDILSTAALIQEALPLIQKRFRIGLLDWEKLSVLLVIFTIFLKQR